MAVELTRLESCSSLTRSSSVFRCRRKRLRHRKRKRIYRNNPAICQLTLTVTNAAVAMLWVLLDEVKEHRCNEVQIFHMPRKLSLAYINRNKNNFSQTVQ